MICCVSSSSANFGSANLTHWSRASPSVSAIELKFSESSMFEGSSQSVANVLCEQGLFPREADLAHEIGIWGAGNEYARSVNSTEQNDLLAHKELSLNMTCVAALSIITSTNSIVCDCAARSSSIPMRSA